MLRRLGRGAIILASVLLFSCNFPAPPESPAVWPTSPLASADPSVTPFLPLDPTFIPSDAPQPVSTPGPTLPPIPTAGPFGLPTLSPTPAMATPLPNPITLFLYTRGELVRYAEIILAEANRRRAEESLPPLVAHDLLIGLAFTRSEDMVARSYFSHIDPVDGTIPAQIYLTSAGFGGVVAENIFATTAPLPEVVEITMRAWMGSDSHRENLLNPAYHYSGAGLMGDGTWWKVTQLFAERKP